MAQSVIGALRVNLGIDTAAFSKGVKEASGGLARLKNAAKVGFAAVATGAAAAATALGLAVRGSINAADEMSKASQKFGVPIEELSRLKYAADLSGVSFEGLGTGIRVLSRQMVEAADGTGKAADLFRDLGIEVRDADGAMKSSSDVLKELADRFADMPDGAEKTAAAMELMGRSGANLIPMLNGGAEALGNMLEEADSFGQVFTKEMGEQAEAFNDNLNRLSGILGNVAAGLAQDLLPYLVKFSDWLVENSPVIREWILIFVDGLIGFGRALVMIKDGVKTVIEVAQAIVAAFRDLPAQLMQIGKDMMAGLWNGIKGGAAAVKDGVVGIGRDMVSGLTGMLGIQSPSKVMYEIGVNIMQGLRDGMSEMKDDIEGIAQSISQTVQSAFEGIIDRSKSVTEAIGDVIQSLSRMLLNKGFQMLFGAAFGGPGGLFGGLPRFARGGSILPGGSGGIDSQIVAFKKSPQERVDIYKPGADRGGPVEVTVRGVFVDDNGVVKAQVQQMGASAARAGADIAVRQVRHNFGGMAANAQVREL